MILLLISIGIFGQTLVNYSFNNNLNPDNTPAAGLNPVLQYFDPPNSNPVAPTDYSNGYLNFANNLDYVTLSYNSTNFDDVTLQFKGGIGVFFAIANGTIKTYLKIGSNNETLIASRDFDAFFLGSDTFNFSLPLPTADFQSQVQVRIEGTSNSFGIYTFFGIDNLSLVRKTTTINVKSTSTNPVYPLISYDASASTLIDTDFGSFLTNDAVVLDKTYKITNIGSSSLTIKNLEIIPNDVGFSFVGSKPTSINVGNSANFTVRFAPFDQGVQTAKIVLGGNIVPDNPFTFEVKGAGKSCNLSPVPIAEYGFTGNPPSNMNVGSVTGFGTPKYIGGTTNSPNPSNFGGRLYNSNTNNNSNLFSTDANSLYARGNDTGTVVLEFGPVDISNQQEVSVNFDLAAFGTSGDDTSGVKNSDEVTLSVWNGSSWSDEMQLKGSPNNNNNSRRKYKYGSPNLIRTYDGDGVVNSINNGGGNGNYGSFTLKIPPSFTLSSLLFRIAAKTSDNKTLWLMDNVHVDAGNAKVKTWTGTGWSDNNSRPSSREKALFTGDYNFTGAEAVDLSVCECEVNSGVNLTVPLNKALTVRNKITNHNLTGDNFIVESDANLLQEENGIINTDNITVKRTIKIGAARNQYNYLGTPVSFAAGETFKTIYPGTTFVLYHNETNNMFYNSSGVNIPGRGLAVKEPTGSGESTVTAFYKGVPQNGNIIIPITNKDSNPAVTTFGYNLVGNPYASNIDLLKLYDINGGKTGVSQVNSPNISSTFYFWDNTGNLQMEQQGSGYEGQAYAIFNVLTGAGGTGTKSSLGTKVPTNIVKVGQGFMTRSLNSSYNFLFNNSIRTKVVAATDFLGKGNSISQNDRYWLQLTAPSGITSNMAIVHYSGGNNLFGPEDSRSMGGSDVLYSMVESEKIAINGRNNLTESDIISLGTTHFVSGEYTIGLDDKEGIFANGQNIYLKDIQTGTVTNLSEGNYTFAANAGESTGRFEIIYQPETVLATDGTVKDDLVVYRDGSDFVVKAQSKKITVLDLYDGVGRLIFSMKPNNLKVTLPANKMVNGVYFLKINQSGKITTKKILK